MNTYFLPCSTTNGIRTYRNNFFDDIFSDDIFPGISWNFMSPFEDHTEKAVQQIMPKLDVTSNDTEYTIMAEVPGMDENAVTVELHDNTLVLSGEKKQERHTEDEKTYCMRECVYGSFKRMIALPDDIDDTNIHATQKDGVLTITIPRVEQKTQSRQIAIAKA